MRQDRPQKQRGYSLGELMIVLAVASLLTAVAVPSYQRYAERAKVRAAIGDLGRIQIRIEEYLLHSPTGVPDSLAEVGMADLEDPWGNPYQYLNIEGGANPGAVRKNRNLVPLNTDYDLYSMGKDGASRGPLTAKESRDDVVRANNGGYIGRADDY